MFDSFFRTKTEKTEKLFAEETINGIKLNCGWDTEYGSYVLTSSPELNRLVRFPVDLDKAKEAFEHVKEMAMTAEDGSTLFDKVKEYMQTL